eukprot:5540-Heterococcus_DN1.PRE.2
MVPPEAGTAASVHKLSSWAPAPYQSTPRHRAEARADARAEGHATRQPPLALEDVVQAWDTGSRLRRARMLKSMHRGLQLRQGSSSVTATALYSESLLGRESTHCMTATNGSDATQTSSLHSSAEVRLREFAAAVEAALRTGDLLDRSSSGALLLSRLVSHMRLTYSAGRSCAQCARVITGVTYMQVTALRALSLLLHTMYGAAFVRATGGALMLDELVRGDATATAVDVLREEEDDGVSLFDRRVALDLPI